jgi:hypothetical protein
MNLSQILDQLRNDPGFMANVSAWKSLLPQAVQWAVRANDGITATSEKNRTNLRTEQWKN